MDKKKEFVVTQEEENSRLDQLLVKKLTDTSRTHIKKLIENKLIKIDNQPTKAHHKVKAGEKIEIYEPPPKSNEIISQKIDLQILYEDSDILVINKPAGLLVHPTGKRSCGTLVNALAYHFGQLPSLGSQERWGIVHRLDEGTSGVMVVAKTEPALRNLSEQFKKRKVKKEYLALVKGVMELDEGVIDVPIGRHHEKRQRMSVRYISSKIARTNWKVIERFKKSTLVSLRPETGRTHQLRVHMAHIGHPILGDKEYGVPAPITHQALCAHYLGFIHPLHKKFMEFEVDLPSDFKNLIENERIR
jgi:23S rRNA pseudouridine1911/1915/1917 synthase